MIKLEDITSFLGIKYGLEFGNFDVHHVKAITDSDFGDGCLGWCSDSNFDKLKSLNGGAVLVSQEGISKAGFLPDKVVLLIVDNPRRSFSRVLDAFFAKKTVYGIHPSAVIDSSVEVDEKTMFIGPNVVIEEGCQLASGVSIGANTVIKHDTILGKDVKIGSNCTIGGVGFGYEQSETGEYVMIPHIGNVILEAFVEIGNNVCIDRAVLGSTKLHEHVKVDNLVHIAHGVEIEENSLIIAHAMVAGSVSIGKNVWVAPSSSIRQKLSIGDDSLIGLGSVVVKNVENGQTVMGVPAKPMDIK